MKTLILLLSLFTTTASAQCSFLEQLSPYQQGVAYQTYRSGAAYDLGVTAVAVAWQESKLGLYKIRHGKGKDISFGVFHIASYWKTKGMSAFERGRWAQRMVEEDAFSIQTGVSDLLYWHRVRGSWRGMLHGYNAGSGSNQKYVDEVVSTVRELKTCEW